jgi:hypothetical protein
VQVVRLHAPAAVAASSSSTAGAVSSSIPPAGSTPGPIILVLGPTLQMVVTEVPVQYLPPTKLPVVPSDFY